MVSLRDSSRVLQRTVPPSPPSPPVTRRPVDPMESVIVVRWWFPFCSDTSYGRYRSRDFLFHATQLVLAIIGLKFAEPSTTTMYLYICASSTTVCAYQSTIPSLS